ncbi:MAG: nucleotidyl transferase AbiEii/AbiGii toxin family protein [Acidobacteriota bacterium]
MDVAIDKDFLGFGDEDDLRNLSVKERDKIVNDLDNACKEIIQNSIFDSLHESFSKIIGEQTVNNWRLEIDKDDPFGQTILFGYPRENSSVAELEYIKPIVRIELGSRPENQPAENHLIQPYAAEEFPNLFEKSSSEIKVLSVERTFWEKATILHDQFHRADDYKTADRISRHYYDFYKLTKAGIAENALANLDLLESVVINKKSFFYRAGAKYEEALLGQLHLVPSPARLNALKRDYEKMNSMFFVEPPKFYEIIELLTELEKEINSKVS